MQIRAFCLIKWLLLPCFFLGKTVTSVGKKSGGAGATKTVLGVADHPITRLSLLLVYSKKGVAGKYTG